MESLHKHILPFLLRRMKEDVLQDLPPKIIQDYHCELSPLQVPLSHVTFVGNVHWRVYLLPITSYYNYIGALDSNYNHVISDNI